MTRRTRVLLVLGGLLGIVLAYEALTSIVAYTDDAYVRSDLVAVAPEVTGRIVAVRVADNQAVKQGDVLLTIDPVPFELAVAQHQAEIAEARDQLGVDQDVVAAAQDALRGATAAADLAERQQQRVAALAQQSDAPREQLDQADETLARAAAALAGHRAAIAQAQALQKLHQAALDAALAAMATAQWQLARTTVTAPVDGTINNLALRPGDTARRDEPLIGIVDAHRWRIVANYKQDYLPGFHVGQTAWVWLDTHPWRLRRGRIEGIARAISRSPDAGQLLPYVAPTTDWVRLQRRFPVTIRLVDPPPDLKLYMGADARTVIFP